MGMLPSGQAGLHAPRQTHKSFDRRLRDELLNVNEFITKRSWQPKKAANLKC